MTTNPNGDRLDRIEALLEQTGQRLEENRQLAESNGRSVQAILDAMTEARFEREELRESAARTDEAIQRLTTLNEGVVNLLARLDDDRPTILRKLNSIEGKVDRLLEGE